MIANTNNYYKSSSGQDWEIVIGMEVHAQILSESKLFSGASVAFGADPNSNVSLVDAAFPGMLPVINKFCIDQAIKTGLGINGTINKESFFDRKNYFYPDLPSGYQISQFHMPIVSGGYIEIDLIDNSSKKIEIERLHMEQDAAKCFHDKSPSESFVDLNRSGVGLMEIVTKPDMRSAYEATQFLRELRSILRYLKTCDGNMDEGSMRADINISVRKPNDPLGTRVEVKNVNSIRFIEHAINIEVARQVLLIEEGLHVDQETRLFDPVAGETRVMRSKEDALDYRYFPDPDLPKVIISEERIISIRNSMPELPAEKIRRYMLEYELSKYDASILCEAHETTFYFEKCIEIYKKDSNKSLMIFAKLLCNWIMVELFSRLKKANLNISSSPINENRFVGLMLLIEQKMISGKIAKEVLDIMFTGEKTASEIVQQQGLIQITDIDSIEKLVNELLLEEKEKVIEYQNGKTQLFGFFVGQLMKKSGGKINPALASNELRKKLSM